ncbi:MAG: site-specific integrase [Pseudomonadota bacterium]
MPRQPKPARLYLRNDKRGAGPRWIILHRGREYSTGCGFEDRAGAEAALADYLATHHEVPIGIRRLDQIAIADVITVYLREHAPTVQHPGWIADMSIAPIKWWGSRSLADIRKKTCHDYADKRRADGVGDYTIIHELSTLRAAINYYHAEHGPLPAVPVVTTPKAPETRRRALERSEVARLLAASIRLERESRASTRSGVRAVDYSYVRRFILIALYSGSRPGVALSARWLPSLDAPYFDLERGVLYRAGTTERQTHKRKPPQRIHQRLMPHLRRWSALDAAAPGIRDVCHCSAGRAPEKLRRSWATIREAAGLEPWVTPHVLRHTRATWMMRAGVDPSEAAGWLGMSEATLRSVYLHHHPDFQAHAAAA